MAIALLHPTGRIHPIHFATQTAAMACAGFNLSSLAASLRPGEIGSRKSSYIANGSFRMVLNAKPLICRPLKVTMMAKREIQMKEIREMPDDLINETVVDLKGELFLMRCKKVTRQDYQASDYQHMKKKIARMLTVKRERELERGIKPRESRKLKKIWKKNIVIRPPPSLAAILAAQNNEEKSE